MLERVVKVALALTLMMGVVSAEEGSSISETSPIFQSETTIRKTVQEVRVGFHLSDRNGKPFPGLQKNQVSVYQDGKAAGIAGFYEGSDLPLRLLLMIDASDSMTKGFSFERDAAGSFLRRVVRPGVDESALAVFSTKSELEVNGDASSPATLQRISTLHSSGLTALFDSIRKAAEVLPARDPDLRPTRRVLVLLSDGDDTYSLHSLSEAIAAAQRSDLVIYAVTAPDSKYVRRGDSNLEQLAKGTGGRVFYLKKYQHSEKVFAEIEEEIRQQYMVTFRPSGNTCGFHSVRIAIADPRLQARARAGFYGDCM